MVRKIIRNRRPRFHSPRLLHKSGTGFAYNAMELSNQQMDSHKWTTFYRIFNQYAQTLGLNKYMYSALCNNDLDVEEKFEILGRYNENIFISEQEKLNYWYCWMQSQKRYYAFCRLAFLWKYKKAEYRNSQDMSLEPIDKKKSNVITVYQDGNKYLFKMNEINRLIKNSLCKHEYDTPVPCSCKNPYNNIPFTKSELYNMYFAIQYSNIVPDVIFTRFFQAGFNMKLFYRNNHCLLNQEMIKNKYNSIYTERHFAKEVVNMLEDVAEISNGYINIPRNKEVSNQLRPFLKLYYEYIYSSDSYTCNERKRELLYRLDQIIRKNPLFGKKCKRHLHSFDTNSPPSYYFNLTMELYRNQTAIDDIYNSHLDTNFIHNEEFPYEIRPRRRRHIIYSSSSSSEEGETESISASTSILNPPFNNSTPSNTGGNLARLISTSSNYLTPPPIPFPNVPETIPALNLSAITNTDASFQSPLFNNDDEEDNVQDLAQLIIRSLTEELDPDYQPRNYREDA